MDAATRSLLEKIRNPRWYVEHFITIRTKSGELQTLRMKPAQERLYEIIREEHEAGRPVRLVVLKARQLGFSTVIEALFFQDAATRAQVRTLIVAHIEDATAHLFKMNKLFFDKLPPALKPMRKNSNAQEIVFENPTKDANEKERSPGLMSSIRCVTAGGNGVGRSDTLTNVHASEAAFWPHMNETLDGLLQAVPNDANTAVIIETTPNGYNEFKTFWDDAAAGRNGFRAVFFPWYEEPSYRMSVPPGTEWTQEELALKDAYGLDGEQLAWRRWCIRANLRGDEEKFRQEYPSCPEEAFLMSGNPYFDNDKILVRIQTAPQPIARGRFVYGEADDRKPVDWQWQDAEDGEIVLFEKPDQLTPYVLGGDTAGDGSDRFTACLVDNATGYQTARMMYDGGSEIFYTQQLYCLGRFFNTALIGVEINFSTYPERKLEEWNYPKLFIRERPDDATRSLDTKKLGWRTDMRTRPLILANLQTIMRDNAELLRDAETLQEMLTFVKVDGRPEAAEGKHDDLVLATAIAYEIRTQQSFERAEEQKVESVKLIDRMDPKHKKRRRR